MIGCEAISRASPFCKQRQQGRKSLHLKPNSRGVGCGPRPKNGPGRKINGLLPNQKPRGPSNYHKVASVDQRVEGGVTLFHFGDYIGKSLVPHREIMNQRSNLNGVSSQSHRIYVPTFKAAGGGNTPHAGERYYRAPPYGASVHKFFWAPSEGRKHPHKSKNQKIHQSINICP
jgi:hypothetical protein